MLYKKKWTLRHFGKIEQDKMSEKIGISPEISQILKNRDIITEKDAEIFMNPSLDYEYLFMEITTWTAYRQLLY